MRLRLLYEQILTYEQFIQQPNWADILYYNWVTRSDPFAAPDLSSYTINNDTDIFINIVDADDGNDGDEAGVNRLIDPINYISQLLKPRLLPRLDAGDLMCALALKTNNIDYIYDCAEWDGKRRPKCEGIIKQSPYYACQYAKYVIKGRWPEAEEIIKTNPECAYQYARDVIKGRWPEAEETIKTDPGYACQYAKYVIKGRWPEAEEIIKTNPGYAYQYTRNVVNAR